MIQKNLDFLKDGLKYLGFGEGLNEKSAEGLASQKPEFQLRTVNEYGKDKASYVLDFKKSDQSEMYFFNKYTASVGSAENAPEKSQAFYINKNSGITAKEAYNLLNGRAVNKDLTNSEGQKFNAWLQLDFSQKDDRGSFKVKQFHQGYGYNLKSELFKHPIKELTELETKERLLQSLERGNLHEVTFVNGDKADKMFIEANPQFKTLNIYDSSLKKVYQENEKKETKSNQTVEVAAEKKQEQRKGPVEDKSSDKGQKTSSRKGLKV